MNMLNDYYTKRKDYNNLNQFYARGIVFEVYRHSYIVFPLLTGSIGPSQTKRTKTNASHTCFNRICGTELNAFLIIVHFCRNINHFQVIRGEDVKNSWKVLKWCLAILCQWLCVSELSSLSSQATKNPFYLHVGMDILHSLEKNAKVRYDCCEDNRIMFFQCFLQCSLGTRVVPIPVWEKLKLLPKIR